MVLFIVVRTIIFLFNIFPFHVSCHIGRCIGYTIFLFDIKHRKVALENLRISFPHKPKEEIHAIAKSVFKNIGIMAVEIAKIHKDGKNFIESSVRFEGMENMENALRKGKGVLLMSCHMGNWEMGAIGYGSAYPTNFVVRPIDNPYINGIARRIRGIYGSGLIVKKNAIREILRCLRRKESVAILMDQNVLEEEGVDVDFFGRKTCTSPVVSFIALRKGTPVLPVFAIRESPGKIKIIVEPEVEVKSTGDRKADIQKYTQLFTGIIETYVRRYPDQWFWVHNRWKR